MKHVSSLVNQQGKFDYTENGLFHNFCKGITHIFESFPILQCQKRGILNPHHL